MDLFGMYADSDEEAEASPQEREGQSVPDDDERGVSGTSDEGAGPDRANDMVSPQGSQMAPLEADRVSVGQQPAEAEPMEEDAATVRRRALNCLPSELRDRPPGDPIPVITVSPSTHAFPCSTGRQGLSDPDWFLRETSNRG